MSPTESTEQELRKHRSAEGLIDLLEFWCTELGADNPLRIASHPVDVVHDGETYYKAPVQVLKPGAEPGRQSTVSINTFASPDIVEALRLAQNRGADIDLVVFSVLLSDPDEVEDGPYTLHVTDVPGQGVMLQVNAAWLDDLDRQAPAHVVTPTYFPGAF